MGTASAGPLAPLPLSPEEDTLGRSLAAGQGRQTRSCRPASDVPQSQHSEVELGLHPSAPAGARVGENKSCRLKPVRFGAVCYTAFLWQWLINEDRVPVHCSAQL